MRSFVLLLALSAAGLAATDGTVTNLTTGKPQPGVTVTLYKVGGAGPEALESVKTDAQGKFAINRDPEGPTLLQSAFDGVVYNHMIPPGSPFNNLQLQVYNAVKKSSEAAIQQHMVLLEPTGQGLSVSETYFLKNEGKYAFNNPEGGTFLFYVPPGVQGNIQVNAQAPEGLPIRRAAEQTRKSNIYSIDFPIKPGESRIDIAYALPGSGEFASRVTNKGDAPRLVVPSGVTLKGDGLQLVGTEPRTQASIYSVKGAEYKVSIEGSGALNAGSAGGGDEDSGPGIQEIRPRIYDNIYVILGLALGILAIGFILLYRRSEVPGPEPSGSSGGKRR